MRPRRASRTTMAELLDRWTLQLRNRSFRNDGSRVRVHLKPYLAAVRTSPTSPCRACWGGSSTSAPRRSSAPGTQRGLLGLLSRDGLRPVSNGLSGAATTICRNESRRRRGQWRRRRRRCDGVDDDETPRRIMATLPGPLQRARGRCSSSRSRPAACVLARSSASSMEATWTSPRGHEAASGIAHSWRGPLKESKASNPGKTKFVPADSGRPRSLGHVAREATRRGGRAR